MNSSSYLKGKWTASGVSALHGQDVLEIVTEDIKQSVKEPELIALGLLPAWDLDSELTHQLSRAGGEMTRLLGILY